MHNHTVSETRCVASAGVVTSAPPSFLTWEPRPVMPVNNTRTGSASAGSPPPPALADRAVRLPLPPPPPPPPARPLPRARLGAGASAWKHSDGTRTAMSSLQPSSHPPRHPPHEPLTVYRRLLPLLPLGRCPAFLLRLQHSVRARAFGSGPRLSWAAVRPSCRAERVVPVLQTPLPPTPPALHPSPPWPLGRFAISVSVPAPAHHHRRRPMTQRPGWRG